MDRRSPRGYVDQRNLVERAKRGDHDAFAALAEAKISRQLGVARLILRDPELARDATQDAMVRVWRDLPGLRDPDRFDAWLHRLTVNACLDLARRRKRRPIEVDIDEIAPTATVDPAGAVAERDQLDVALRRLEPDWRAVVVLHYYMDLPLSEVAAILQIPVGTAKSRLNRALTLLRGTVIGDGAVTAEALGEGQPA